MKLKTSSKMPQKCKYSENDEKCKIQASYGSPSDRKVLFCKNHKSNDHIDLRSQKCQHIEEGIRCSTQASFGSEKDKKKLFCREHKRQDDIDLKSQKCKFQSDNGQKCINQAIYGTNYNKDFCSEHKNNQHVENRSRKCIFKNSDNTYCNKVASFGTKKRTFCSLHRTQNCNRLAGYNCKNCEITEAHYGKNNKREYCAPCFAELHPESVQGRMYLIKQKAIVEFLKKHFTISSVDKVIKGGKSKRRPDIIIDCGSFVIVIEIDELQHNNGKYDSELYSIRNQEIYEDLGSRQIIFIRFNPDSYKIGSKKFKGCFDSKNEKEYKIFNERMVTLVSTVEKIQKEGIIDDKKISVQYLYYDSE